MACRGFLQCLLKIFNLLLAVVGVLLLVYSLSLYVRAHSKVPPSPPPPASSPTSSLSNLPVFEGSSVSSRSILERTEPSHQVSHPSRRTAKDLPPTADVVGHDSQSPQLRLPALWFIYLLIASGCLLTLITIVGAIAAETNSGCCLSCYQFGLCFLLLLQCITSALIWLKDIPEDPTGTYDAERKFVLENLDLCRLAGVSLLVVEATALLLAMMLRAIQVDSTGTDDDDDDLAVVTSVGGRSSLRQPLMRHQMSYPAPGHGSYPPSASASPPYSHVSGHAAPAGYPAVGVPSLPSATSNSAGVSAHHAPGTAPIASMSDAWRSRLLEKYGLDVNEYQYSGERQAPSAPQLPESHQSRTCVIM